MVYKFFDKKTERNEIMKKMELAEELQIIFADLANIPLLSKFNKGICFLLCVINIFSKYAWVISLKDKRDITITKAFQKMLNESNCKPNNIWVDKDSEFYNISMKSWLEKMQHITKKYLLLLKYLLEF